MTDPATPTAPAATPPPTPPAAPVIDAQKIASDATAAAVAAATRAATDRLTQIGQALMGQPAKTQEQSFIETFVTNPAKVLSSLKDITKKEMRDEDAAVSAVRDTQRMVVGPMLKEYPELNTPTRLAFVERMADAHKANGKTYAEALDLGAKDVVRELGLKSVTDAIKDGTYRAAGLPGAGGAGFAAASAHDEGKSQNTFIAAMRASAQAVRNRSIQTKE